MIEIINDAGSRVAPQPFPIAEAGRGQISVLP